MGFSIIVINLRLPFFLRTGVELSATRHRLACYVAEAACASWDAAFGAPEGRHRAAAPDIDADQDVVAPQAIS